MKHVNALAIRNSLGRILDDLKETNEPVIVSKGRKVQAVLITPEQFKKRFLDYQAEERKKEMLDTITSMSEKSLLKEDSLETLRSLRGYR
jgi:PHD/YefM family antitoxin component YafN of YafNO toxin-antitoxin module